MSCFHQGDARWGTILLGDGPSTIGRAGCMLVLLTEAARRQTGRTTLMPPQANEILKRADAFKGDSLDAEKAARALGMECPYAERVDNPMGMVSPTKLDGQITKMLERGLCIIHVDHNGDLKGDHFIMAIGSSGSNFECLDPALARSVFLLRPVLTVAVKWRGKEKTYRVQSIRPIRPLPQ